MKNPVLLMRLGMLFLALGIISLRFVHPAFGISEDALDFVRGTLYGLAMAFLFLSIRRRGQGQPAC